MSDIHNMRMAIITALVWMSFMLLVLIKLMVLMWMMSGLIFMTPIVILMMILMMIQTMRLVMKVIN